MRDTERQAWLDQIAVLVMVVIGAAFFAGVLFVLLHFVVKFW